MEQHFHSCVRVGFCYYHVHLISGYRRRQIKKIKYM
nr:MAG TPA: hypothetical protein [Caudoviricetes sp.]